MSIRGSFPSILSSAYNADDEDEHVSPSKFNQMREQQMLADIMRADANLKGVKVFRTQNEKLYKDKELRELHKKEIQEPLTEAYTVIEVLEGKLARRDEMIHKLRKYISVDMLKANQGSFEDTKAKVLEFNQVEEHNQMVLMDSVSELQKAIEHQNNKIERNKITIAAQRDKIKSLSSALEAQDFHHKEQIRTIESDKILYLNMLECKDNIIQDLNLEKSTNKSHTAALEQTLSETQSQLKKSDETVQQQAQQLLDADAEYKVLLNKYATMEDNYIECQDTLAELEERFTNLRTRYEGLVTELDGMVEAGFIIPTAEELQASRGRGKRDTMKRQTSIKLTTKGKSGKFGRDRNSILGGSMSLREDSGLDGEDSMGFGEEEEESKSFASPGPVAPGASLHAAAGASTAFTVGSSSKDHGNSQHNKFHQRMENEDAAVNEQIKEGRAARRGDALSIELTREIVVLKQQMAQQQSEHADALRAAQLANKSLESAQMIVSTEMRRLTVRNQELATINNNLQEEMQEKERRIETLEEQTNTLSSQMAAIAQQVPPEVHHIACGADSPPPTPPEHSTRRGKSRKESADMGIEYDDESFGHHHQDHAYDNDFDVNEYMNAPPVDAATQMGASEFASAGTQFPFLDDPDYLASHQTTQTSPLDVVYPTEFFLETLFRDYIEESQTHIPPHNLHVLQLSRFEESVKEKASRLGGKRSEDPNTMLEEAATFRVKRALGYLSALNDLRNRQIRYINNTGAWSTVNARMVIRCIDLVLQTTHNILCPVTMIEDSDYMELRNATDPGEATYYSDEEEEDHQIFGQLQDITTKWRRSAKGAIRKDSTFPLTETDLATDHNYGAPRGIVTHVGQTLSKAVTKYMNRAASRARRSINVDQLLDEAEERARTASPSGRGMTPNTPRTPHTPMTPRTVGTPLDGMRRSSAPPRSANTPGSRASSRGNSFSGAASPGRTTPSAPAPHASPLISAFAAKVMAMATYAYGSDSSRESSPKQTSRKVSSVMPILEATHSMELAGETDTTETIRDFANIENLPLYAPPPQHGSSHAASVIQGYYNFGREVPQESLEERQFNARNVRLVDLTAMDVGLHDDAMSQLKVKFKDDRSIGVSFHVKDESEDDEEGSRLLEAFKARKHSRAAKKASLSNINAATGDFVDFQRLPFNPDSVENTPTYKKKSVSNISASTAASPSPTHRKASAGVFKSSTPNSLPHRHNSTGHYSAAVEASIRSMSQSPHRKREPSAKTPTSFQEPAAPKPRDQSPDHSLEPKGTHFTFPDSCLETYLSNMPDNDNSRRPEPTSGGPISTSNLFAKGSVVLEDEEGHEELLGFPAISSAQDGQNTRSTAGTPTLAEHADHLQTLVPLASPSPTHLAEPVRPVALELKHTHDAVRKSSANANSSANSNSSSTSRHKGLATGAGLKGLLQRNIEASALAVFELQEQQRQRDRPASVHGATMDQPSSNSVPASPSLSVQAKGAGLGVVASSVRPPVHARPSSSKVSVRNSRQKNKEIDWAGPATIPVYVASTAAPSIAAEASPPVITSAPMTNTEPSAEPAARAVNTAKSAAMTAGEVPMPRIQSRKENLQLSTEGNVDLNTMLLASQNGQFQAQPSHTQHEAVVIKNGNDNVTPTATPRAAQPDMTVAGQRRSHISKKEKVTNAMLYM